MFDLRGKRALVTGASRGVGAGIARHLAAANATVVLTARNVDSLAELRSRIDASGGKAEVQQSDLATLDGCRELANRCGDIDILVNNAAHTVVKLQSIVTRDDDYWSQSLQLNLMAPVCLIQEFCPGMAKRGSGVVINISSTTAQRVVPNYAPYAASKAALEAMSRVAAMDLARSGVRVVVVALGMTDTEALAQVASDFGTTSQDMAAAMVPTGRLVSVDEAGRLCCFLASAAAAAITGVVITIDNGATAGQYSFAGQLGTS